MTRSMTLIKIYFVNTIKALGQEVGAKLAQRVSPVWFQPPTLTRSLITEWRVN
jgi:hypothetical protein